MRATVAAVALYCLVAVVCGGVHAVSVEYAGTLNDQTLYYTLQPFSDAAPELTLLRVELNVTDAARSPVSPFGAIATNVQVIMRDPSQKELTTVSAEYGALDSTVAIVCPTTIVLPYVGAPNNYSLVVMGTVGAQFYTKLSFISGGLSVDNDTVASNVHGVSLFKLYFFTLTQQQVDDASIKIMVTSPTTDLAVMYITPDLGHCVTRTSIDAPSNSSARLTFSTTATFTLSKGSFPSISTGRWYVAVVGRNLSALPGVQYDNDNDLGAVKPFVLAIATGPDYDFTYAVLVTILVPAGIALVLITTTHLWLFKTSGFYLFASRSVQDAQWSKAATARAAELSGDKTSPINKGLQSPDSVSAHATHPHGERGSLGVIRAAGLEYTVAEEIPFNSNEHPSRTRECTCAQFWELLKYWGCGKSSRGYTFSWHTLILACGFGVAGYQVVTLQWRTQQLTGDRDICAYNEKCYHPHPTWDVPWNNIVSNFPYMILGLAFNIHCAMFQFERPEGDFSLFFALGWSLIAEGCFSLFYHLCPTTAIFQFDTAFMFVISVLQLLAVYQTGEGDTLPMPYDRPYNNKFFKEAHVLLFCIVPLLIFNYLGALFDTDGLYGQGNYIAYWVMVCVWETALFAYVAYQFEDPNRTHATDQGSFERCCGVKTGHIVGLVLYACLWGFYVAWTIVNAVMRYQKVAGMFLFKMLGISFFGMARVGPVKERLECGTMGKCEPKLSVRCASMSTLMATTATLMAISLKFFFEETTDKSLNPWESRALNHDCSDASGYFELHDLWHITGAFALFTSFLFLLYLRPPPNHPVEAPPAAVDEAQRAWATAIALESAVVQAGAVSHPSNWAMGQSGILPQPSSPDASAGANGGASAGTAAAHTTHIAGTAGPTGPHSSVAANMIAGAGVVDSHAGPVDPHKAALDQLHIERPSLLPRPNESSLKMGRVYRRLVAMHDFAIGALARVNRGVALGTQSAAAGAEVAAHAILQHDAHRTALEIAGADFSHAVGVNYDAKFVIGQPPAAAQGTGAGAATATAAAGGAGGIELVPVSKLAAARSAGVPAPLPIPAGPAVPPPLTAGSGSSSQSYSGSAAFMSAHSAFDGHDYRTGLPSQPQPQQQTQAQHEAAFTHPPSPITAPATAVPAAALPPLPPMGAAAVVVAGGTAGGGDAGAAAAGGGGGGAAAAAAAAAPGVHIQIRPSLVGGTGVGIGAAAASSPASASASSGDDDKSATR